MYSYSMALLVSIHEHVGIHLSEQYLPCHLSYIDCTLERRDFNSEYVYIESTGI